MSTLPRLARSIGTGLCLLVFSISIANAASVVKVVKNRVLVEFDQSNEKLAVGDRFIVIVQGKRRAIISIQQVKNSRAIADIEKGTAEVGGTLQPVGKKAKSNNTEKSVSESGSGSNSGRDQGNANKSGILIGVVVGMNQATQEVTAVNAANNRNETISMKGTGFSARAILDLPFMGELGILGRFGLEQFKVTGNSSVSAVSTDILYASGDALVRYNFSEGNVRPLAGIGAGLQYPVSKSSNILDLSQVSATMNLLALGGVGFAMTEKLQGLITAEYAYYLPSNNVKTNYLAFRAGVTWDY